MYCKSAQLQGVRNNTKIDRDSCRHIFGTYSGPFRIGAKKAGFFLKHQNASGCENLLGDFGYVVGRWKRRPEQWKKQFNA